LPADCYGQLFLKLLLPPGRIPCHRSSPPARSTTS
jgi:hypothetical protein